MANQFELTAELRSDVGKGASRRLRRLFDKIPAIIYGGGETSLQITLLSNKVKKALENEAFYSHILTLDVEGKKQQAVLKNIQRHPSKPMILHMDFQRIKANEPITMRIPLHFIGEAEAPGVKEGGVVSHIMTDVEIRCLPKDLPEFIAIDLSNLHMNDIIHLSDVQLPEGVQLLTQIVDGENDLPIVNIHIPRAALIEEEVAAEAPAEEEAGEGAEGKKETQE